jgi:hypothetical protein
MLAASPSRELTLLVEMETTTPTPAPRAIPRARQARTGPATAMRVSEPSA